jgi:hypothetical protein
MLIDVPDMELPLCPNVGWPGNSAHELHNRTLDAFYNAVEKDVEGEMPEPVAKAYNAAAYGQVSDRMNLYREAVVVNYGGSSLTVQAWWFKCPICGFVLPASERHA